VRLLDVKSRERNTTISNSFAFQLAAITSSSTDNGQLLGAFGRFLPPTLDHSWRATENPACKCRAITFFRLRSGPDRFPSTRPALASPTLDSAENPLRILRVPVGGEGGGSGGGTSQNSSAGLELPNTIDYSLRIGRGSANEAGGAGSVNQCDHQRSGH